MVNIISRGVQVVIGLTVKSKQLWWNPLGLLTTGESKASQEVLHENTTRINTTRIELPEGADYFVLNYGFYSMFRVQYPADNLKKLGELISKKEVLSSVDRIALGTTPHPELAQETLQFAISDAVRSQDLFRVFVYCGANPKGRRTTWSFTKSHWELLQTNFAQLIQLQQYYDVLKYRRYNLVKEE
ncbi:hypothetical protein CONCODRAFT_70914 [Conidiobolus coronatus NRRL 28638]|uniref:ERAP1-like C-terminal domain-containing protein n=1 Tax=Conidiobolus coronatus (strain ATCC 28846 / CBS 209.66 / NRRL 28638) TaxID=796925 RepID=A0A137P528_CONC2|nr:hypothetical protein CONCODRAFT_70914 [Conidiobolus coronatus NRRL 28638]|eukprot:KXN70120.1 hypothetical protein CONCODRAFT_70914 [Conidiobolus coronatus NRRL 28638]